MYACLDSCMMAQVSVFKHACSGVTAEHIVNIIKMMNCAQGVTYAVVEGLRD